MFVIGFFNDVWHMKYAFFSIISLEISSKARKNILNLKIRKKVYFYELSKCVAIG